jgi:single-strand DNA-binding protein
MANVVVLSGRLTKDPEVSTNAFGTSVCRFNIAVQRNKSTADFFMIETEGKTADFCSNYFRKGRKVTVDGKLESYSYKANDGATRYGVKVKADHVEFADSKPQTPDQPAPPTSQPNSQQAHRQYDSVPSAPRENQYPAQNAPVQPPASPNPQAASQMASVPTRNLGDTFDIGSDDLGDLFD